LFKNFTDVTGITGSLQNGEDQISIYLNPGNGLFNLNLADAGTMNYELRIVDIFGKIVHGQTITPTNGTINQTIDFTGKSNGLYFVELTSDVKSYQTKISIR